MLSDCQAFSRLEMVKNSRQLPCVLWINSFRKHLDITRHFLAQKSQKMLTATKCSLGLKSQKTPSDHQAFFKLEIVKNASRLPNAFWIKEKWESQRTFLHRYIGGRDVQRPPDVSTQGYQVQRCPVTTRCFCAVMLAVKTLNDHQVFSHINIGCRGAWWLPSVFTQYCQVQKCPSTGC